MNNINFRKEKENYILILVKVFTVLQFLIFSPCIGQNYYLSNGCVEPDSSIIAWWTMDEDTSLLINDIIGQYNGVLVNEASHLEGMVGNAVEFDGVNDYIAVSDNDLWAFGINDFTIELWANFNTNSGGSQWHPEDVLISHNDGSGSQRKWWFGVGSVGLHFHINAPEIGPKFFPIVPFVPEIGRWYHIAITRSSDLYTIYIDGTPGGSEINTDSIANPSSPLTIGQANEPFGGYVNGKIDEVTIYNKALSEEEIFLIYEAENEGKCKNLNITTEAIPLLKLGNYFSFQLNASLGIPPYYWSIESGNLLNGLVLDTNGTLYGIPEQCGDFSFSLKVQDSNGDYVEKSFDAHVLITLPEPDLRISKTGTVAVPGREVDYFILVENIGEVMATNIQIGELLNPFYDSLLSLSPPAVASIDTIRNASIILWLLPEIQPSENILLTYKIALSPETPLGTIIHGGPVCTDSDIANNWQACLDELFINSAGCAICAAKCAALISSCGWLCSIPTLPTLAGCLVCIAPCVDCLLIGIETGGNGGCIQDFGKVIDCFTNVNDNCEDFEQTAIGPLDPNEKLVLAERFIKPDQTLVYPIHYENIGDIEAKDVFITDTLDENLDLSTLEILTPVGSYFNEESRVIGWELYDINLQPGETDNVLYSIKPKPDLSNGTIIRNKANIQFEVFDIFTTNEVVNIIDNTPPTSAMDELPPETTTEDFTITWHGNDTQGKIKSFSIFTAVNNGTFEPYIVKTTELITQFTGEYGKSYSFICIAEDSAGNIEAKEAIAEASTTVQLPKEFSLLQNSPNPFHDQTTIEFSIPNESRVLLEIYDIAGRKIATLIDEDKKPGIYKYKWKPNSLKHGVYLCTMITSGNEQVIKIVFVNKLKK